MTEYARKHLQHEMLVGGASNTVFNGLIAWLLLRNGPPLQWHGDNSFAVDVIATTLLLPFVVALIVIPLQRAKLRKGALQAINLGPHSRWQKLADRFPTSIFKSAVLFGLVSSLLIAPPTLLAFYILGIEQVTPANYAIFKGLWAGVLAALTVTPMVLCALRAPAASPP